MSKPKKRSRFKISKRDILEGAVIAALTITCSGAIFYSGYVKGKDDELEKIGKGMVYPPLSNLEKKILDDIKDNPEAIQ
ncbi:MAG: hypothetical protein KJ984_04565, partial [Nanoarchaeota archaeon]|nr:hypothetical protein [Nanoarchaeota archaeon]